MRGYVSFLVLLAFRVHTADAAPRFQWPSVAVEDHIDLPDVVEVNGVPVKMRVIVVRQSGEKLLQTYATAFEKAGLWINTRPRVVLEEPSLTALDTAHLVSYSVIFRPLDDNRTEVILGEANVGVLHRPGDTGLALPKDATKVFRLRQEMADIVSFQTPRGPAEALAERTVSLKSVGFRRSDHPLEKDIFVRGSESLHLHVQRRDAATHVLMVLHRRAP
jgi:hypothetical protein